MKIKLLIIFLILSTFIQAQMHQRMKESSRLERLEKLKLIEELNLDEETSAKLVSRLSENRKKQRALIDKKMKLIADIEKKIGDDNKKDNKFYEGSIKSLLEIEKDLQTQREEFIQSLNDILTPEQILKTMIFEVKFREEVKEALMKKNRR